MVPYSTLGNKDPQVSGFSVTLGQTTARHQKREDKKVSVTNINMKTQILNMVPAINSGRGQ